MRKISLVLTLILMFVSFSGANAENTLRQPQGRIGTLNYKTENYNPNVPTNLSSEDIKNLHKLIANINESTLPDKKNQEIKNKQESNQLKELQRQRFAEQKKLELQKQKEQKVVNKKAAEEEKLAQKRIKEQEKNDIKNKKTILSHSQNENTQKEETVAFKLNKKNQKQNAEVIKATDETNKKNNENNVQQSTNFVKNVDTQNIVNEITLELSSGRGKMLEELSTLWVSAVQKSDTVYFAIMKLSNPNGEEVNKNGFKKILEPIIGAAPLVGQAFVNPALTAGSIIGSNVMGTMMNDSAKNRLTKVNDADLVILARAIDELQESLLINYMAYKGAKEEYEFAIKIAQSRQKEYEELNKKNSSGTILANTFYTEALDNQYKARQEFLMKRVVLEQMVGAEALNEIENPTKENSLPDENKSEK